MINDLFYYFVFNRKKIFNNEEDYYIIFIFDSDNYSSFIVKKIYSSNLDVSQKRKSKQLYPKSVYQIIKTDSKKIIEIQKYLKTVFEYFSGINFKQFAIKLSLEGMNDKFLGKRFTINF